MILPPILIINNFYFLNILENQYIWSTTKARYIDYLINIKNKNLFIFKAKGSMNYHQITL
jgi:hypothetical protein